MKIHPSFKNIRYRHWHLHREYKIRQVAIEKKRLLENKYNIKSIEDLEKLSLSNPEIISNTKWDISGYGIDIYWCDKRIQLINKNIKKEAYLLG